MGESTFGTRLDPARHWILAEHKLLGEPTVPGSAFLEIARAAAQLHLGQVVTELSGVDFLVPLVVPEGSSRLLHIRIWDVGPDTVEFRMVSSDPDRADARRWTEHARGRASAAAGPGGRRYDVLAERSARGGVEVESPEAAPAGQVWLGPRWRGLLTCAGERSERAFAQLRLPPEYAAEAGEYGLHPALLDLAAGSYGLALAGRGSGSGAPAQPGFFLPIGYDRIRIRLPLPASVICLACPSPGYEQSAQLNKLDIVICDEAGDTVADITGFTARQASDLATTLERLRPHEQHHVIRWQEVPPPQDQLSGQAVLVASDGPSAAGRALAAELRTAGCAVTEAVIGAAQPDCESLFATLPDRAADIAVYVAPEQDHPASFSDDPALRFFEFVKALAEADAGISQLCVVARHVDRISGDEAHTAPWLAALFGLAKTIGHEINGVTGRSLDIDEATDLTLVAAQVLARDGASAVGLRGGRCFGPELVPHVAIPAGADAGASRSGAGVGRRLPHHRRGLVARPAVARHLAATQPGVRLALAGRTVLPQPERQVAAFRELEELGAQVRYYPADVARADQVAELIGAVHADFGRIGLIVHSAGLPGNGLLLRKDKAAFAATLSPKTAGAWHLDAATADEAPEMILFASTIGLFGGVGQSDYTAANSFLDAFASYRSALGRRTVAVDWSDWLDTGMAADHGLQADSGFFLSVRPSAGLASFDEVRAGR